MSKVKNYKSGEVIYSKDSFEKAIGRLKVGSAVVHNTDENGAIVRVLEVGDYFGVATVFNDEKTYVSSIAAKTDCEVEFFAEDEVAELINSDGEFAMKYIKFLTSRIGYLNTLIDAYASQSVVTKLSKYLVAYSSGMDVPSGLSMTDLSKSLGVGRASLYRALDELIDAGAIEKKGKEIVIKNLDKLREF